MIIFKNYLKVVKSFLPVIIVYSCIFIGIAMITSQTDSQSPESFEPSQARVSLVNHDKDTELIQKFKNYLQDNSHYIELEEDEFRDALFFRRVDYIMIIPKGFTEAFIKGEVKSIETMDVPDAYYSVYSKNLINKYFNTVSLYLKAGFEIEEIENYISQDLAVHTDVSFINEQHVSNIEDVARFYNFSNYALLTVIITVVCMTMLSFQEEKVNQRHMIAPVSPQQFHFQIVLGNIVTGLGIWLLYVLASCILYGRTMLTLQGFLFVLNALLFTIFALVLSVLITTLTHNRQIIGGLATVIGLGTSFISGSFVPQELLSTFVLNLAKFTPSYWFVHNNNLISQLSNDFQQLTLIGFHFIIIIGFTIVVYVLTQMTLSLLRKYT